MRKVMKAQGIALRLGTLKMIEHIGQFGVYGAIVGAIYRAKFNHEAHEGHEG